MNKNTVQRIFQLTGWQVRKRAIGIDPRFQALPSEAQIKPELFVKRVYDQTGLDR